MEYKKIKFNDGFSVTIKVLTAIEWLDLELSSDDSESFSYATEVAYAVENWNGLGKVDPLELLGDKSSHIRVFKISQAIEKLRDVPELEIEESPDGTYVFYGENFKASIRALTVLEFLDLSSVIKKSSKESLRSELKCKSISSVLIDWNSKGALTATQLYENREYHNYVIAIDRALGKFFRFDDEIEILDIDRVLGNGGDNGRNDDTESISVESKRDVAKGFSVNLERV